MPARRVSQSRAATKLARLRTERGLTQIELAEASGISIATLRRLERGAVDNPPLRYLANCAIVLGCQLEDLVEDEWRRWLPLAKSKPPRKPQALWKPGRYTGKD